MLNENEEAFQVGGYYLIVKDPQPMQDVLGSDWRSVCRDNDYYTIVRVFKRLGHSVEDIRKFIRVADERGLPCLPNILRYDTDDECFAAYAGDNVEAMNYFRQGLAEGRIVSIQ